MKKVLSLVLIGSLLAASCTKNSHGSDDIITQQKHGGGVEDNPNGGGGKNIITIPTAVATAFKARYPDATNIEWKLESDGTYKVEFYRNAVKWQAIFTPSGKLVKEEHN